MLHKSYKDIIYGEYSTIYYLPYKYADIIIKDNKLADKSKIKNLFTQIVLRLIESNNSTYREKKLDKEWIELYKKADENLKTNNTHIDIIDIKALNYFNEDDIKNSNFECLLSFGYVIHIPYKPYEFLIYSHYRTWIDDKEDYNNMIKGKETYHNKEVFSSGFELAILKDKKLQFVKNLYIDQTSKIGDEVRRVFSTKTNLTKSFRGQIFYKEVEKNKNTIKKDASSFRWYNFYK